MNVLERVKARLLRFTIQNVPIKYLLYKIWYNHY